MFAGAGAWLVCAEEARDPLGLALRSRSAEARRGTESWLMMGLHVQSFVPCSVLKAKKVAELGCAGVTEPNNTGVGSVWCCWQRVTRVAGAGRLVCCRWEHTTA